MSSQLITIFAFGVVFVVALVALAIFFPKPTTFQYNVFRIVLALAAAGVAAMIPGFIDLNLSPTAELTIRAGGALAVFVMVYFFNPAQLAVQETVDSPAATGSAVTSSIQAYHIIRGAVSSPTIINTQIEDDQLDEGRLRLWNEIFDAVNPANQSLDLNIKIEGNELKFSNPVEIWLPHIGFQAMGAHRKVLDTGPADPVNLRKLFNMEYPGGGSYFPPENGKMTLSIHGNSDQYETEQLVVSETDTGFRIDAGQGSRDAHVSLARRPATILVDDFDASDDTKDVALSLVSFLRGKVSETDSLKLSPHTRLDLAQVHDELKQLPLNHPAKGLSVADYTVDYIVSGSIVRT